MAATAQASLRQRHAERTRNALVKAALELFAERGFLRTTIDDIAAHADVAPRTFFRYFAGKEAVLYHDAAEVLGRIRDCLAVRPASEPPHRSLFVVCAEIGDDLVADARRMRLIRRLSKEVPSVLDYQRVLLLQEFEDVVVDTLATSRGIDRNDLELRATTAALLSALGVAFRSWVDLGAHGPLRPYIARAMFACRRAFADESPLS
jgi:AcrR family transcriptional regulator